METPGSQGFVKCLEYFSGCQVIENQLPFVLFVAYQIKNISVEIEKTEKFFQSARGLRLSREAVIGANDGNGG